MKADINCRRWLEMAAARGREEMGVDLSNGVNSRTVFRLNRLLYKGMRLSDDQLNEFISIYREEFGAELDRLRAEELAGDLLRLYEALASRRAQESTDSCVSEDERKKP